MYSAPQCFSVQVGISNGVGNYVYQKRIAEGRERIFSCI